MKTYVCSDLHISPTHFLDQAKEFLEEAVREADRILLCGDIVEGSWNKVTESLSSKNGNAFLDLMRRYPQGLHLFLYFQLGKP